MQSVFGGNQMLGCSILLGMAAFHGATFCNIVPDHGVLLLRCVGLSQQSQHLARGTKGARFVNERSWSKECLPCSCHANTLIRRLFVVSKPSHMFFHFCKIWNQCMFGVSHNLGLERISLRQKMFTLDPTVLLRRCFGLSQHFVPGAKGARIVTESIWSKECLSCSCTDSTLIERFRVD